MVWGTIAAAVIGGAVSKSAADKQASAVGGANAASQATEARKQAYVERQAAQARGDVARVTPQAQQVLRQGFQGAANILRNAAPQQLQALQQGNVGAQEALLAGKSNIQRQLLGLPTQSSPYLQPRTINPSLNFMNQAMPKAQQFTAPQSPPVASNNGLTGNAPIPNEVILQILRQYGGGRAALPNQGKAY